MPTLKPAAADAVSIIADPAVLPGPITRTTPATVEVLLETRELNGFLADGVTFKYWTYNGTVPGPMIRVREGDTVKLTLRNAKDSKNPHSIDLHAVTGPGGGAKVTQTPPGTEKTITFKALNSGAYIYHCATPDIPTHVGRGLYGIIVVEPKEGLAKVDREFYVVQGDFNTNAKKAGEKGHVEFDVEEMDNEEPDYVVFNGKSLGLVTDKPLKAKVGEKVRIFFGVGGPNLVSSFHVIGEIFDVVHKEGAKEPLSNVQTTLVPPGGAAWVEFGLEYPGTYLLVDHALSRTLHKGSLGALVVEGTADPTIYSPAPG